jgi:cysteine desulfuration protein SufE
MDLQRIINTFELLPDWNDRYEFIADLGHKLAPMREADKVEENLVRGCTTRTWVTGHLRAGEPPVVEYHADAEGTLVRGIVALLLMPFQGKTPEEILSTDASDFIAKLGLEEHLSPNRRLGMHAFISKLKAIASDCLLA